MNQNGTVQVGASGTTIRPGQDVDPAAVERLKAQEAAARASGFALKPPVFALGTRVLEVGAENFRRSRLDFDALPRAEDALGGLVARVVAERRRDVEVKVRELRMLDDGRIHREGHAVALTLAPWAFRQLLDRSGFAEPGAAATYLAEVPVNRRVAEVNAILCEASEDATAVVRHRDEIGAAGPTGIREAFAVVSPRYVAHDVDTIGAQVDAELRRLAPGDARGEVTYDGHDAAIVLRWHSDIQPETCAAGEVFRACAGFRTADDGTSSIQPFAGLDRNLCLNLIILDENRQNLGRRRHTGGGIGEFMADALASAVDRVRWFAESWDKARRTPLLALLRDVPDGTTGEELVRGAVRGLLASGALTLPGYRREAGIDEILTAWRREPEHTVVGLVNAITRAAHESTFRGVWAADEVQAAGARILGFKRPIAFVAPDMDF